MNEASQIVCLGDLMLESILPVELLPQVNSPCVVDGKPLELGGTAYNLCWYLSQWNWSTRLIGCYGRRQEAQIIDTLNTSNVDPSWIVPVEGESDLLYVLFHGSDYFATYLRARLPDECVPELIARCGRPERMILAGSRHRLIREAIRTVVENFEGQWLAFCPSYTIYEYESQLLSYIISRSNVIVINESETTHVCKLLNLSSPSDLALQCQGCLVMTLADKGVSVFQAGESFSVRSFSGVSGDVIGAGDAFFAGFFHSLCHGGTLRDAAVFGSMAAAEQVKSSSVRPHISEPSICERFAEEEKRPPTHIG